MEKIGRHVAAKIKSIPEKHRTESEKKALWRNLYDLFKEYVRFNEKVPSDVLSIFKGSKMFFSTKFL